MIRSDSEAPDRYEQDSYSEQNDQAAPFPQRKRKAIANEYVEHGSDAPSTDGAPQPLKSLCPLYLPLADGDHEDTTMDITRSKADITYDYVVEVSTRTNSDSDTPMHQSTKAMNDGDDNFDHRVSWLEKARESRSSTQEGPYTSVKTPDGTHVDAIEEGSSCFEGRSEHVRNTFDNRNNMTTMTTVGCSSITQADSTWNHESSDVVGGICIECMPEAHEGRDECDAGASGKPTMTMAPNSQTPQDELVRSILERVRAQSVQFQLPSRNQNEEAKLSSRFPSMSRALQRDTEDNEESVDGIAMRLEADSHHRYRTLERALVRWQQRLESSRMRAQHMIRLAEGYYVTRLSFDMFRAWQWKYRDRCSTRHQRMLAVEHARFRALCRTLCAWKFAARRTKKQKTDVSNFALQRQRELRASYFTSWALQAKRRIFADQLSIDCQNASRRRSMHTWYLFFRKRQYSRVCCEALEGLTKSALMNAFFVKWLHAVESARAERLRRRCEAYQILATRTETSLRRRYSIKWGRFCTLGVLTRRTARVQLSTSFFLWERFALLGDAAETFRRSIVETRIQLDTLCVWKQRCLTRQKRANDAALAEHFSTHYVPYRLCWLSFKIWRRAARTRAHVKAEAERAVHIRRELLRALSAERLLDAASLLTTTGRSNHLEQAVPAEANVAWEAHSLKSEESEPTLISESQLKMQMHRGPATPSIGDTTLFDFGNRSTSNETGALNRLSTHNARPPAIPLRRSSPVTPSMHAKVGMATSVSAPLDSSRFDCAAGEVHFSTSTRVDSNDLEEFQWALPVRSMVDIQKLLHEYHVLQRTQQQEKMRIEYIRRRLEEHQQRTLTESLKSGGVVRKAGDARFLEDSEQFARWLHELRYLQDRQRQRAEKRLQVFQLREWLVAQEAVLRAQP